MAPMYGSARKNNLLFSRPRIIRHWRWKLCVAALSYTLFSSYFRPSRDHVDKSNPPGFPAATDAVDPSSWPRITDDRSVACRPYKPPLKSRFDFDAGEVHRLDCEAGYEGWVEMDGVTAHVKKQGPNITCTFEELKLVGPTQVVAISPPDESNRGYTLQHSDTLKVDCVDKASNERWSDVFLGRVPNPEAKLIPPFAATADEDAPIQNILVWLTDSISRDYYRYNLPKTWSLLESLLEVRSGQGGFDFKGFNTMGLNSYPNYVPFWTGHGFKEWLMRRRTRGEIDQYLLLNTIHRKSFVSLYYQDEQNTFSVPDFLWAPGNKDEFSNVTPSHYYAKNFMKSRYQVTKKFDPVCIQGRSSNKFTQEYVQSLWKIHRDQRKFFFVAQLTFTHHYSLTKIRMIDEEIEQFFRTWVNSPQVRNNTLVIICADHGNHIFPSEIHASRLAAMIDQARPVLYVLVPQWLKEKYPRRAEAMAENADGRLVTPADLHATIRHLTAFRRDDFSHRRGVSLFSSVPRERTCRRAGVPLAFCGCADFQRLDPRFVEPFKIAVKTFIAALFV